MQKPAENLQQTQGSAIAAEQTTERFGLQRTQKDHRSDCGLCEDTFERKKLTSMEIALNPASLGSVNLHVSSKGGVISAQLYAQDEAVRAALESQVAALKESLEATGHEGRCDRNYGAQPSAGTESGSERRAAGKCRSTEKVRQKTF